MIHVHIDIHSGFCFGVVRAIELAEQQLEQYGRLSSLGHIVHNAEEVSRLEKKGMATININQLNLNSPQSVLIRAHGEPPSTYKKIESLNKTIVDATCPIVLQLQKRVKKFYENYQDAQIVIYGKPGHAEVVGLVGQTDGMAIVVSCEADIEELDKNKPVFMFSQTTMPLDGYAKIKVALETRVDAPVKVFDTICRKVSNRVPLIREFAKKHNVCVFVAGNSSSNGQMLFNVAKDENPKTYFVSNISEIQDDWFSDEIEVGVCGATSTPMWQMEKVSSYIEKLYP